MDSGWARFPRHEFSSTLSMTLALTREAIPCRARYYQRTSVSRNLSCRWPSRCRVRSPVTDSMLIHSRKPWPAASWGVGCGIWAFHRHCHWQWQWQRIIKHCFVIDNVIDKGHLNEMAWGAKCFCNQKFPKSCQPLHVIDALVHCHYRRAYVCLLGFGPQCHDPNLIAKTWMSGCAWLRCMLWIRLPSSCVP